MRNVAARVLVGLLGTMCVTGAGCSNEADRAAEVRRQLLRGTNLAEEQHKLIAAKRVLGDHGELLPSTTVVEGITLPRGFEPSFTFPREWHFDGAVPLSKLESYFRAQVEAAVSRPNPRSVEFAHAVTRDAAHMTPVRVTILEVPGRSEWSRIQIQAAPVLPSTPLTREQIERELAARRHDMH